MQAELSSRPAQPVTAALNVRTMMANDPIIGLPNCSIIGVGSRYELTESIRQIPYTIEILIPV